MPVGDFTVSVANTVLHLRGEASGTIQQDGAAATIDILLQNNLIDLPVTRWDANNFTFDLQKDGSVLHGTNEVFGGLYAGKTWGGMQLDVIAGGTPTRFTGADFGTVEDKNREIAVHQDNVGGLSVTRKVFVPATGYFAPLSRNPDQPDGRAGHRRRARVEPYPPQQRQRSGSRGLRDVERRRSARRHRSVDARSLGGDRRSAAGDPFVSCRPAGDRVRVRRRERRARGEPRRCLRRPIRRSQLGPRELDYQWSAITVPPGGTVALMHFAVQETTRPAAQAAAERLLQLPPEALAGLSTEELAQVENFAAPSDGVSALAPLAPLTGTVTGRVFASDASTPAAGVAVRFQSSNPLFRTYQTTTAADGSFTFASVLTENGASRAIPIEGFTLRGDHPVLGAQLQTPPAAGVFASGSDTAQQDIVFSSTGVLRGIVRLNGAPVAGGPVAAGGVFGTIGMGFNATTASDGSFVFPLMPPTLFTITATAFPPERRGSGAQRRHRGCRTDQHHGHRDRHRGAPGVDCETGAERVDRSAQPARRHGAGRPTPAASSRCRSRRAVSRRWQKRARLSPRPRRDRRSSACRSPCCRPPAAR